jgi:hypothetical protein
MLFRLAIVQIPNNKFVVQKINHTKMIDRAMVAYYLRDHLGPPFSTIGEACKHAEEIHDLLVQIARNDAKQEQAANHEDVHEYAILKQHGGVLREHLNQLTRVNP